MNTPAHALVNLAIVEHDVAKKTAPWIVVGAIVPDVPNAVFYLYHSYLGQSSAEMYAHPSLAWQLVLAPWHAFPILVALLGAALVARSAQWMALSLSMLLHSVGDLLTHHSDAHRHLWPVSDLRWASPVSYWERAHHASIYVPCELLVAALASWIVLRRAPRRWRAFLIGAANAWLCVAYVTGGAFWP